MADFYNEEQVTQILRHALTKQSSTHNLSREQVCEIATELGVSHADFLAAEQKWLEQQQKNSELAEFDIYKRKNLRDRALKYAIANSFLVSINLFLIDSGHLTWSLWVVLIWGLGLSLDTWTTYHKDSEGYAKQLAKWQRQQQRDRLTAKIADKVTATVTNWLK
jgi:2TM domain